MVVAVPLIEGTVCQKMGSALHRVLSPTNPFCRPLAIIRSVSFLGDSFFFFPNQ